MRIVSSCADCTTCPLKCDIYFTAKEMGLEEQLSPRLISYNKNEVICSQGDVIASSFILLSGTAKMYIGGLNHRNIILNIILPSNTIGLVAVVGKSDYLYSVAAISACTLCQVDITIIRKIYLMNPTFLQQLNNALVFSLNNVMQKLIILNQKQLRGKVADSLLYLSSIYDSLSFTLPLTRKELGELSAISEENAVRMLMEFKQDGLIDVQGRQITLVDMPMLKRISQLG